jgi:LPS export ABC transporter protein LptC
MLIRNTYTILYKVATISLVAFFFSCGNDIKEVQDFLADKNLPVGVAKNINLVHTDSGFIKARMITPLRNDFSNRKMHPYQEFPEGIQITNFDKNKDSISLTANYCISYGKTGISEVKDNVILINHKDDARLYTEQLFWDQNTHYIYTEEKFTLIIKNDTIKGKGFESNEDLTKMSAKSHSSVHYFDEKIE